jgi:multidrug efflux system membrane fusion protein
MNFQIKSIKKAANRAKMLTAAVIVSLLAFLLNGCGSSSSQNASFERPPAPVTVGVAEQKDVPVYIDAIGTTVAREMVRIQPQLSGRITQIHFTDGVYVKRGAMLFTIDPRPFQAQLNEAEANVAQARAALKLAEIEWERVSNLTDSRAISKTDIDTRRNAVDVAQAQVQQREAAVQTAKLNLEYCSVRSPIDGRTGQRLIDVGNIVEANTTELLTIQRLDPIYADFTITQDDLTQVQMNMKNESLKAEVRLPDEPEGRTGELTFLDNSVQDKTGTVKLRATVPNQDHHFWPGRFVKVRLILNVLRDAVLVASSAPQQSANGTFVYIVKQDSTAETRPVKVGQQQGDFVVIEEGIKPGEQVVVDGQLGVTPGGKVRIDQSGSSDQGQTAKRGAL